MNRSTIRSLIAFPVLIAAFCLFIFANIAAANSIPLIINVSPAYPGYSQADAMDSPMGFTDGVPNQYRTDFASLGQGTNTFLEFDFGQPLTFSQILYTDRTTSGGANGSYALGTYDFVTKYQYTFSNNSDLSSPVGIVSVGPLPIPSSPTSYTAFQSTVLIPDITARYVEWSVLAMNGSTYNAGASNFEFSATLPDSAVPEPASIILLGTGLIGIAVAAWRRKRA